VQPVLRASEKIILGLIDVKIIEGIVNGVPALIGAFSRKFRQVQTGMLSGYALVMALGVLVIVGAWVVFK
jgi:NADH-quinone oxidoreductase subunit L